MAGYTDKPWDGSDSRFSIEQLLASVPNAIAAWAKDQAKAANREVVKGDLKLPIHEPDGTCNVNALRNALARISQVEGVPAEVLAKAKAEIEKLLADYKEDSNGDKEESVKVAQNATTSVSIEEAIRRLEITEVIHCLPVIEQGKLYDKTGAKAKVVVIESGTSKNKNIYRPEVLAKSIPKFEGARVFYNHRDEQRDFRDLAGEIKGVTMEGGRIVGTLEVLEADQWLRAVIRDKPHLVGLSIYCWASAKKTDEGELIEEIQSVRSVDIVDSPAAGGGVLSVLENQKNIEATPDVQSERKESTVDEKQFAEKIAALEKSLSEKEIALAEAVKAQEVIKAEGVKAVEAAKAEAAKMSAELAGMKRKDLLEGYLAEKRATGLKQSVEGAIRRAVEGVAELSREALDKAHAEWTKVAEDIAKDYAPKAEAAPLTAGLPPRVEAAPVAPVAEAAPVTAKRDFAAAMINNLVGVKA